MARDAPPLDLHDGRSVAAALPSNVDAEQALLGALLFDNAAADTLPDALDARHFYEPLHGRLYAAIRRAIRLGLGADPTVIVEQFRADAAMRELGGARYLADLMDRAPPAARAPAYAATVVDLALRRELIRTAQSLAQRAAESFVDDDDAPVDAKGIAEAAQGALTAIQLQGGTDRLTPISEAVRGVYEALERPDAAARFVRTEIGALDLAMGPLLAGDLVLGAGRTGMGKSGLGGAFSLGVAAPGLVREMEGNDNPIGLAPKGVVEVHGEMTFGDASQGGQSARRHIANLGHHRYGDEFPTYKALRAGAVPPHKRAWVREVAAEFEGAPIRGIKRTNLRVAGLRTLVRRQAAEWEREGIALGLVIVDHVGLLRPDGRPRGRYEDQTEVAIALKELAGELGVPILALIQLSRGLESRDDKRPHVSDLRDSGAWEENADAVLLLYRPAYYAGKEPDVGKDPMKWAAWDEQRRSKTLEVGIGKLREGDAGVAVELWFDLAHNAIRGRAPESKGGFL